jgi:diphthamide synthase (EF-2-diphthine--ammonia ligase)
VLDAPFFRKKVRIIDSAVDMETPITGRYIIKKAELEEKDKKKK